MDEDMRTAMEILISECSCYTPFKPFLMELVATNDLFMPNKLEFLSEVVLHGRDEHKAYINVIRCRFLTLNFLRDILIVFIHPTLLNMLII